MKRIITIIMFLVVTVTTFFPCCAADSCDAEQVGMSTHQQTQDQDDSACSPFSSCTTCTGFPVQVSFLQVPEPVHVLVQHNHQEYPFKLPQGHFSFWQPPRTG